MTKRLFITFCVCRSMLPSSGPTVDQAWDALTRERQLAIVRKAAQGSAFREKLLKKAKQSSFDLYNFNFKKEAKEAAYGTVDCDNEFEREAADSMSREKVDKLFAKLKNAAPFLPAHHIADWALIILEEFIA